MRPWSSDGRETIAQYVEREEKHEAFKQDALRALEDYE
jgi:hypothetical protein